MRSVMGTGRHFVVFGCRRPAYLSSDYKIVDFKNHELNEELARQSLTAKKLASAKYACNTTTLIWHRGEAGAGGDYLAVIEEETTSQSLKLHQQQKKVKAPRVEFLPNEQKLRAMLAEKKATPQEVKDILTLVAVVNHHPYLAMAPPS